MSVWRASWTSVDCGAKSGAPPTPQKMELESVFATKDLCCVTMNVESHAHHFVMSVTTTSASSAHTELKRTSKDSVSVWKDLWSSTSGATIHALKTPLKTNMGGVSVTKDLHYLKTVATQSVHHFVMSVTAPLKSVSSVVRTPQRTHKESVSVWRDLKLAV